MGIIKQDISFPLKGGLNMDDALTAFPRGDWRDLWNMRSGISAGDDEGVFESILSDISKSYPANSSDINDWYNIDFDTFSKTGSTINSAASTGGTKGARSNQIGALYEGDKWLAIIDVGSIVNGTWKACMVDEEFLGVYVTISNEVELSVGLNFIELVITGDSTTADCYLHISVTAGGGATISNVDFSLYRAPDILYPTSYAIPMGFCTDLKTNKFYLLLKDLKDWIVEFDIDNDELNIVWGDYYGVLNFDVAHKILNANILNGILYWTDNNSSPRKLDVEKAKIFEEKKFCDETILIWNPEISYSTGDYVIYLDGIYKSKYDLNEGYNPKTSGKWDFICLVVDCYPILGEQEIDVIAYPPLNAPIVTYGNDNTKKSNNLRGSLFQFAYRYVYLDYRKSVYSPASKVPMPQGEEKLNGEYTDDVTVNNILKVKVNIGSLEVLRIEVIFRSSKDLSTWYKAESVDIYSAAGELLFGGGSETEFNFYNNRILIAVAPKEVFVPFHYVPQIAGTQEIIEENRLVYADMVEGYPNTKLYIEKEITKEDLSGDSPEIPLFAERITVPDIENPPNDLSEVVVIFMTGDASEYEGDTIYIRQILFGVSKTAHYEIQSEDTWADVKTELTTAMGAEGMDVDDCYCTFPVPTLCFWQNSHVRDDWSYYNNKKWSAWWVDSGGFSLNANLKSGASHIVGFIYYDRAKRHGPVNIHENTKFHLSAYNETGWGGLIESGDLTDGEYYEIAARSIVNFDTRGAANNDVGTQFICTPGAAVTLTVNDSVRQSDDLRFEERWKAEFILNHIPPSWATHYQLVYAPTQSIVWFLTLRLKSLTDDGNNVFIDVNGMLDDMRDKHKRTALADYEWQIGDRVRFIGTANGSITYPSNYHDYEIEKIDETGKLVIKYFDHGAAGFDDGAGKYTVVEVYRPAKESSTTIFYEIGQEYEIKKDANSNLYHGGDLESWTDPIESGDLTNGKYYKITARSIVVFTARGAADNNVGTKFKATADGAVTLTAVDSVKLRLKGDQVIDSEGKNIEGAVIEFTGYDSYKFRRNDGVKTYWVESPYYSDFQLNGDMYSLGFPKIEDPDARQERYETKYRWGGTYFMETELNYIAQFGYKDFGVIGGKFGKIQKIVEVGFILKVLLSHKYYSFYIRRISYLDPAGEEKLTLTNKMFGTKRPGLQDWGTQNPESVIRHERYLYFWDRSVGKFIRDAPNGMFAISDYKVKSFFKDISINNKGKTITCYCGYNNRFEELWVTLRYNNSWHTLRFSEYKTRWDGFVNSNPDMYVSILQNFYKVLNSKIYDASTDKGQGYLDFVNKTGSVYPTIEVVANIDPYKIKIWNALAVYASHVFYAPNDDDLQIPASSNYPSGMKTRILKNLWESKEGILYGPVMMDLNTPLDYWGDLIETGDLTNGKYYIITARSIVDFTERGAADNNVGTKFTATADGAVTLTAVDSVRESLKESLKVINGRPMRGEVMSIKLRSDEETSEQVKFSKMIVHATPSEKSKI